MSLPVLHLVFHPSAALDLRRALHMAGRADRVVALDDDFSFGPIGAPDLASRAQWVETALGYDGWDEVVRKDEAFWAAALTGDCHRVAWLSRRSAQDYAGFLELVWRLGDAPFDIVDVTELEIMAGHTALATAGPHPRHGACPADSRRRPSRQRAAVR